MRESLTRILYVEASPRKKRSASIEVARAFIDAVQVRDQAVSVDKLDLWSTPLPEFDGPTLEAKYAGLNGLALTNDQAAARAGIRALADRFKAADLLLFAVPLWNFSIPYKLKHLIDVISQKDVLFSFDDRGFDGLLVGRSAVVVYARGLDYAPTSDTPADSYDFQKPYLELWLRFIGVVDVTSIIVQKTLLGSETDQAARTAARAKAIEAADRFVSGASTLKGAS
jgi:FMN-dependent NADH-azoreductase